MHDNHLVRKTLTAKNEWKSWVFLLAFLSFLACTSEVAPSLQACTCNKRNTRPADKEKRKQRNKESTQRDKQTCYQAKEGVLEGQMQVWIGVRSSIILKYRQQTCAITQSSKEGLEISCTKDGYEPARDYEWELGLMTQTSTQRHMHKHISKDANKAKKAKDGTKQAQQTSYHTKRKGKHVIRHIKRLTQETLTCKLSKGKKGMWQTCQKSLGCTPNTVASKQAWI